MPILLLSSAVAIALAVLSEELSGEEKPKWTVDVPDGVFDQVGGRVRGYLVVDFLARTVRGIAWVTPFPKEETDWLIPVVRLMATDVSDWVRDRLDLLEKYRPDVLAGEGRDSRDSFEESLEVATWGPIRVMQSARQLLQDLVDNSMRLEELFYVLKKKGILPFLDDYGDTTYVTGTRDEQVCSVLAWVTSKFDDDVLGRRDMPSGRRLSISSDELEPLALLGEPCLGFDVVFDVAEGEEEWAADVAREWSFEPVQRPDGTQVFRYLVRER